MVLTSLETTENNDSKQRRRFSNGLKQMYYCNECGYTSNRQFNVTRHAKRMHSKCIRKKCCDMSFFRKSDYYQHIEDHHPYLRSSCSISRNKYKIYGGKSQLSNDFRCVENATNNSNASNESFVMRRSMRIQKRTMKSGKLILEEVSSPESDDDEDDDDDDSNKSEELTDDSHNHQPINSSSSKFELYENSKFKKYQNNSDSINNNYCQHSIYHDFQHIEEKYINNSGHQIHFSQSLLSFQTTCLIFNDSRHEKAKLDTDKNILQTLLEDKKMNTRKNTNILSTLPLKKRILCEINNNVYDRLTVKNNGINLTKTSSSDKENQSPINVHLNEYQGTTIAEQILTIEESMQMWNNITRSQRDYLRHIDFDAF